MIEPRVYRAAFIPALLAVVLAMFSFQSRPRPLEQGLAADVLFDGEQAAALALQIAEDEPDRRPGRRGNLDTAEFVAGRLNDSGFEVCPECRWRFVHAGRELENVVGRRAGGTRRQIVIVAARDAATVPDAPGSAADTAALLELARVFRGRPTRRSLVLASVDGSTLGEIGTSELIESGVIESPRFVDAVVVLSDLGSDAEEPSVQAWSNRPDRVGIGLARTMSESVRLELGQAAGGAGWFTQIARLSFPIGIGPQGVLLAEGYDALRVSGSGELPPAGDGPPEALSEDRLGGLGRAALRTVTALDGSRRPPAHGPDSYLLFSGQVLPAWVISLLAGTLLLPALVASVDAFARARRRGVDVLPWLRWLAAWVAPFAAGLATAEVLALAGATPAPPPAPVAPTVLPLDGPALAVLGGVLGAMLIAWWLARWLAARPAPQLALKAAPERGAGVVLALGLSVGALLAWAVNPYAGLLAVPAAHLWMLAVLPEEPPSRRLRLSLIALGLLPALLLTIVYLFALELDPIEGVWYVFLLVTGHSVGFGAALIGCLLLGCACGAVEITWRTHGTRKEEDGSEEGPSLFGPGSYAGPGSLGRDEVRPAPMNPSKGDPHGRWTWPPLPIKEGVGGRGRVDPALRRRVQRGEYLVDTHAVAEAMVRSGVFETPQIPDWTAGTGDDEA